MTEGRVFTLKLPMRMKINKGGELESLNLNVYRNLHFYKLNYQKKAFQDFVKPLLLGLPSMEAVSLHYEINPKGGSRLDTMNVGSIVDKFFSDALVQNGIIPDDDYKHVVGNSFSFGSLHPTDPHVLVTITETKTREETPMRILLDQQEIQTALETFVSTMGIQGASGVQLTIIGEEIQAEIIVSSEGLARIAPVRAAPPDHDYPSTETTEQPPKRRGGRLPGSKNKPKGDTNVAGTAQAGNDLFGSGASDSGEEEDQDLETSGGDESSNQGDDLFGESGESGSDEADGTGPEESTTRSSTNRGNLFGDSDTESSETSDPDDEGSDPQPEETEVKADPPRTKRPSIFDAE